MRVIAIIFMATVFFTTCYSMEKSPQNILVSQTKVSFVKEEILKKQARNFSTTFGYEIPTHSNDYQRPIFEKSIAPVKSISSQSCTPPVIDQVMIKPTRFREDQ